MLGVTRAFVERRNTCFEYLSTVGGVGAYVAATVVYEGADCASIRLELLDSIASCGEVGFDCHSMFNSLPVGVLVYGSDGHLMEVNAEALNAVGVDSKDDLLGINLFENPSLSADVLADLKAGKDVRFFLDCDFSLYQEYYRTKNTSLKYYEFIIKVVRNEKGEVEKYLEMGLDITIQEQKQRQSQRKIELAIKSADIMLWEFDVNSRLFCSDNEPMNNYDESVPMTPALYLQVIHPKDKKEVEDAINRMEQGEDFSFVVEGRMRLFKDEMWQYCTVKGVPFEFGADGKVVKFVGTRANNTMLHNRKLLQDSILNNLPLAILIKDVEDDYRYIFCNDESMKMLGIREDITTYDVMDAEAVERIRKTDFEVFSTGRPFFGTERISLKDGRTYDTIVRKSIIEDSGKRLLLTTRWDQSYQNDLKRRSKILTMTMEEMNAYTWFFDTAKNRVNFGEGFSKVGKKAMEVNTPETFVACIHPDDQHLFSDSLRETVVRESGKWNVEYRVDLNGDGRYQWWRTQGIFEQSMVNDHPLKYMFGMSICVDQYKQTEFSLLRNKADLNALIKQNELILNNTNSGLAYITTDFVVQWENVSICSASLSFQAYRKGEKCYVSTHGRTTPCPNCVLYRAMKSKQMEQISFHILENDIEVFATPVFQEDGEVVGIVIRVDDVTERERMIEELRMAKSLAEQSDKLKSAFLANMSHEIRTPLNAIVGFSDLLTDCSEEERKEYVQIIATNNDLLLKLINDILDLSKIESGAVELKYEEFELSDYFDDLWVSMKQRSINPLVQLTAINPYVSCIVQLDRNRIAQIITNYVTNAIKYTPEGVIEMGYECRANSVYLYVKDSGIGIPDEKKHKVFHRFEKLDEFAQGTGLGLSICKAIAEAMGGKVGFESESGQGSLFWTELPCTPIVGQRILMDDQEVVVGHKGVVECPVIIVAEDMHSNYNLLKAMLSNYVDLIHAANGMEAVDLVRSTPATLLLMDMKMPLMDGLTATEKIREFNTNLPIVALTAHAFESDQQAALAAGCNDYLVKPINWEQFFEVLRKYGIDIPSDELLN